MGASCRLAPSRNSAGGAVGFDGNSPRQPVGWRLEFPRVFNQVMNRSDDSTDEQRDHDRMTQLESRLAFLEHTVDVLGGELEAQQNESRALRKALGGLQEQLEGLQRDTGIDDAQNDPPPHY